jgi:hypothetical protein
VTLPTSAKCLIRFIFAYERKSREVGDREGKSMLRRKVLPAALLAVLPAVALAVPFANAIADECRTKPGSSAAPSKHWYYRVNRSDHRHCWYLGSTQTEQSSRARRAISIVQRPLILDRTTAQPDRDQQTRSAGSEDAVSDAVSEVAVQEPLPHMNFASRWADWAFQDVLGREVAATSYLYTYPTTRADQGLQFVGSADDANSVRPEYAFRKVAFGFFLLAGALAITLTAFAAGLLKLARASPASGSNRFTIPNNYRQLRHAGSWETTSARVLARIQTGRSVWRSRTASDPSDDFKTGLRELMGALQRASARPFTLRSFAPAAGSRRSSRS